jgi:methionine synthase II (cobalamin-independent)
MGNGALPHGPSDRAHPRLCHRVDSLRCESSDAIGAKRTCRCIGSGPCSSWLVEGDYEPIARPIFQRIGATRLLLEYDDERSGSFAPLRHVSDDKMVVLELISTKRPQTEAPENLICRITEASRFVPLERLALSPQCGFASSIVGNDLSIEDERRKLETVCETARRIWR